jgi:oligopeptide/dipeptide ABC transporter ATP-binding protein
MALSSRPDLLIADEPTTSLDVTIQAQILDLLIELQLQTAISVILVTHNMGIVAEACHEVAVLYAGCIVEFGSTRELFRHPSHPYTQGLLMAMPLPGNRRQSLKVIPGSVPSGLRPSPGCAFASRCDSVMEVCRQFPPPMVAVAEGHRVACYLWATSSSGRENA